MHVVHTLLSWLTTLVFLPAFGAPLVFAAELFQLAVNGAAVSSAPSLTPSTLKTTPTTATLSEALAESTAVPVTVAFAAGAVRKTVGGTVSTGIRLRAVSEDALAPAGSAETSTSRRIVRRNHMTWAPSCCLPGRRDDDPADDARTGPVPSRSRRTHTLRVRGHTQTASKK